jgi:hypothetical protein
VEPGAASVRRATLRLAAQDFIVSFPPESGDSSLFSLPPPVAQCEPEMLSHPGFHSTTTLRSAAAAIERIAGRLRVAD